MQDARSADALKRASNPILSEITLILFEQVLYNLIILLRGRIILVTLILHSYWITPVIYNHYIM